MGLNIIIVGIWVIGRSCVDAMDTTKEYCFFRKFSLGLAHSLFNTDCRAEESGGDRDRQAFQTYYRTVASGHVLIHVHVQTIRVHHIFIDHAAREIAEGW